MFQIKGVELFDKLMYYDDYDHLSERDQYMISLMHKKLSDAVYKHSIDLWKTWAAKAADTKDSDLEEPLWNCKEITEKLVRSITTDILSEKVMRFYEAYIYNNHEFRRIWKWARHEYGGLKNDLYCIM
ncbi:hypothetical protein HDC92_002212 [Pedobacter sp. AK017]|uniref:hypothetical protein n=1 Tax=Pedobacter sp. AK017 TaxID=2723073 RepID=UPI001620D975|nr:hypothetical protein [Pedobacter sp. AK017]MBB5438536.1 hypothetical protein [Pedobacter sp. AK017]